MQKVQPGDKLRIPAATFNTMVDAAEDFLRRSHSQKQQKPPVPMAADLVLAKNSSGVDCPRFGVLQIDGPLWEPPEDPNVDNPFLQPLVINCWLPYDAMRMVIAAEPIANGQIGHVRISGLSQVRIKRNDTDLEYEHVCARVIEGDVTRLQTCGEGFVRVPLLWAGPADEDGNAWAIVRVGSPRTTTPVFPVGLSQSGGSQGDESTQASWTYDVVNPITDELLAEAVDPTAWPHQWQRPSVGYIIPATFGYAHRTMEGELVLGLINEVSDQQACEGG